MITGLGSRIPDQRQELLDPNAQIDAASQALVSGELVVLGNGPAFALVGSARDENIHKKIRSVKGEARGDNQPLGWTVPFERSLGSVDTRNLTERRLFDLMTDADKLTKRIGALTFLRAHARDDGNEMLPGLVSQDQARTVQIYSPVGKKATERLIEKAITGGAEPVMTSVNTSGTPEIISEVEARAFSRASKPELKFVADPSRSNLQSTVHGSYPIIALLPDRLRIIRLGCFSVEILRRLLIGYPVDLAPQGSLITSNHPDSVLEAKHLEKCFFGDSEMHTLRGDELRHAIIEVLDWNAPAT